MRRTAGGGSTLVVQQTPKPKVKDRLAFLRDPVHAVTWTEKYSDVLDRVWNKIPSFVGSCIATLAVFLLGITMNGEWLLVLVHALRQLGYGGRNEMTSNLDSNLSDARQFKWSDITLENLYLKDFQYFWIGASSISYIMFFGIGGFLHWYFYVRQRDTAHEWKCQPRTWLSPELERHEIAVGSFSLLLGSTLSALIACYVSNGGWSMFYYNISDYPWYWFVLQWPAIFIYQDYLTYWHHRMYHTPFLYKHFHKLHHKYKQPTAFSVTAIHPVEFLHMQSMLASPMFLFPIHWVPYSVVAMYTYYHGIIDHSGINFKAYWWQPWQPDAIFHDNHHQYFHVNFGFNIFIWDKLHGTYRRKDRVYREDIYYGQGKALSELTPEELEADLSERRSENPRAYRGNTLEFELLPEDLKKTS